TWEMRHVRKPPEGFSYSSAFSPDGKWVAIAGDERLLLWNLVTGEERAIRRQIHPLVFSPDSRILATDSSDNFIRLRSVPSGKTRLKLPIGEEESCAAILFSPDGALVIALLCTDGGEEGFIWQLYT